MRPRGWTFSSQSRLPVAETSRREKPNSIHQELLDSAHHEFSKTKDSPTRGECGSRRGQFLTVGRQALSLGPITPYETLFLATSGRTNGPRRASKKRFHCKLKGGNPSIWRGGCQGQWVMGQWDGLLPGSTHGFTGRQAFLVVSALEDNWIPLPPWVSPSCQQAIVIAAELRGGLCFEDEKREGCRSRQVWFKLALTGIAD